MESLLTSGDAARVIGISREGVRAALLRGDLPSAGRTVGGFMLFRREDCERFKAARARRGR